jgi:hypothetical protein
VLREIPIADTKQTASFEKKTKDMRICQDLKSGQIWAGTDFQTWIIQSRMT